MAKFADPKFAITRRGAVAGLLGFAQCSRLHADAATDASLHEEWLQVNGTRQWLGVAGSDRNKPVVLLLHGGPGGSETLLFRHFNRALELEFPMAYWDQRGAGKSFDPRDLPGNMTVAQFVEDLAVVVAHLHEAYGGPVFLLGHSWGSALGLLYSNRYPNTVAGFIGVAQVSDQGAQEAASYAFALSAARQRQNSKAIQQLEKIGRPPLDVEQLKIKNKWVESFDGYFAHGLNKYGLALRALLTGETSFHEIRQLIAANEFSLGAMWPEVRTLDVAAEVRKVNVPVAFLLGRLDGQAPASIPAAYLELLDAPDKKLIYFEDSAHNIPFEQPAAFNSAVVRLIHGWLRKTSNG